jgi:hypothetical protein
VARTPSASLSSRLCKRIYFFGFPDAFTLLPRELADTTPDWPALLPLAPTVVAPMPLVLFEPEVIVVLVLALLPFVPAPPDLTLAPLLPGLSLEGTCGPSDPPDAVDISESDDL